MSLDERIKYASMKARYQDRLKPWYKRWWGRLLIALGGLLLIALTMASLYVIAEVQTIINQKSQVLETQDREAYVRMINGYIDSPSLGPSTAPITIVEFGDFACPYCFKAAPVIRRLAEIYPNQVRIVWRDYLRNEDSIDLAVAGRCAAEQGKFWEMHDALFANQVDLVVADAERPDKLLAIAAGLKLDPSRFAACLEEKRYLERIKQDYQNGNNLQIVGTPSWFINNHLVSGYLPEDNFRELIDGLLPSFSAQ